MINIWVVYYRATCAMALFVGVVYFSAYLFSATPERVLLWMIVARFFIEVVERNLKEEAK